LQQDEPVYGQKNPRFIDFIAPGIIIVTSFAHSIGLTAVAFVQERENGTMDRVFAAGGRASEIIIGMYNDMLCAYPYEEFGILATFHRNN